jgi:hypothetical protein
LCRDPSNGKRSFEGAAGSLPILTAAFGGAGASDFTNSQFIRYLQTGQAGALAGQMSSINGAGPYFCNLVGAGFAPCQNNAGYTGAGAGYPINFFQANPFAAGNSTGYMAAAGYSNYNGLQVDLRQGSWKGLQFDANYTWSHLLGIASPNDWTGAASIFTLRDPQKSYRPSLYDLTNVVHLSGTYDLPIGKNQAFLVDNVVGKVLGGVTVRTIMTPQSGAPLKLDGGYHTFNDYGDGGVVLHGVTSSQLQHVIGVHCVVGQSYAQLIDPKYLKPGGCGANPAYITPNTTPGTIGAIVYLHGPHAFYQDLSISKSIPIHDRFHFQLQGEFLNVWNHPVFGNTAGSFNSSIQSSGFGRGWVTNESSGDGAGFGRIIELRGNLAF